MVGRSGWGVIGSSTEDRASRRSAPTGIPDTVWGVDVRIGVTQAPRELTLEVLESERETVEGSIGAALSGATDVLWITDKRGRKIAVPAAKIAYVEVGAADGDRRIGFGG